MAGPSDTDVIAAVGTAQGRAGIGIVRVSGKKLDQFALNDLSGAMHSFPTGRLAMLCFVKEDCPTCGIAMPLSRSTTASLYFFPHPRPIPAKMCSSCRVTGGPWSCTWS